MHVYRLLYKTLPATIKSESSKSPMFVGANIPDGCSLLKGYDYG